MDTLMRKAWSIVGYTYEGAYYCFACVERKAIDPKPAVRDEPSPVFLSDDGIHETQVMERDRPSGFC